VQVAHARRHDDLDDAHRTEVASIGERGMRAVHPVRRDGRRAIDRYLDVDGIKGRIPTGLVVGAVNETARRDDNHLHRFVAPMAR
jgi:hypothetical protein